MIYFHFFVFFFYMDFDQFNIQRAKKMGTRVQRNFRKREVGAGGEKKKGPQEDLQLQRNRSIDYTMSPI